MTFYQHNSHNKAVDIIKFTPCALSWLQEERRLRTAYENAERSEREKFALFSAAVRESHEKERTRAERTKNWSIIGSVLGALIGVMGSTYINRVRLQVRRGDENCLDSIYNFGVSCCILSCNTDKENVFFLCFQELVGFIDYRS